MRFKISTTLKTSTTACKSPSQTGRFIRFCFLVSQSSNFAPILLQAFSLLVVRGTGRYALATRRHLRLSLACRFFTPASARFLLACTTPDKATREKTRNPHFPHPWEKPRELTNPGLSPGGDPGKKPGVPLVMCVLGGSWGLFSRVSPGCECG